MQTIFHAVLLADGEYGVWFNILAIMLVLVSLLLILLVLLQDSKGGGLGGAFGAGGAESLLGARVQKGLNRVTTIFSCTFLLLCLLLGIIYNVRANQSLADKSEPAAVEGGLTPPGEGVPEGAAPVGGSLESPAPSALPAAGDSPAGDAGTKKAGDADASKAPSDG